MAGGYQRAQPPTTARTGVSFSFALRTEEMADVATQVRCSLSTLSTDEDVGPVVQLQRLDMRQPAKGRLCIQQLVRCDRLSVVRQRHERLLRLRPSVHPARLVRGVPCRRLEDRPGLVHVVATVVYRLLCRNQPLGAIPGGKQELTAR